MASGGIVEERLRPLNGLLGLVRPDGLYPSPLADAGLHLVGLEIPATTPAGKVIVDALLHHPPTNLLVACEVKSGANIERPQALRYAGLDVNGLIQTAQVTIAALVRPSLQVVFVCLANHLERIRLGLEQAGLDFPILTIGGDVVTLHPVATLPQPLQVLMTPVAVVSPIPSVIAFDHESDAEAMRPAVAAELVAALTHRRPQVGLTWLTEQVAPHASLYGRSAKRGLRKSVEAMARAVATEHQATFLFVPARGNDEACVRVLKTPEDLDPRGRTQAYQALSRQGQRQTRSSRTSAPDQLDLLHVVQTDDDGDEPPDEPGVKANT